MTDINTLLDASLDDLADLPEYAILPAGAHKVRISVGSKQIKEHPAVEVKMVLIETIELANPAEDAALAPGAESSVAFMLDNEIGQGKLKEFLKPLAEATGISGPLSAIIEAANGMEVTVVTKVRKDKNDPDKKYGDIVRVSV
jgi:hypothetical protein